MIDIIHRVGIKAPAARVYAALSTIDGLAGWWTKTTTGSSKVGGTIAFRFQQPNGEEIGGFDMEVLELVPEQKVRWRVKEGPAEWMGTDIEFILSRQDDYTIVMFGHRKMARRGGVHGALLNEVGHVPVEPARPRRDRQGTAGAR